MERCTVLRGECHDAGCYVDTPHACHDILCTTKRLREQLADAQATIAALQARVQELEDGCEMMTHTAGTFQELWRTACDQREAFEQQLTQRTAELEAAKRERDVWYARYNELSGVKDRQLNDLQAELERVRAEHNKAGEELQREVNTLNHLLRNVGLGQGEIDGMAADFEELTTLRTLILALPKVEGEIMVSESLVLAEDPDMCSDMSDKDEAMAYAALLKHHQGMEG